MSELVNYDEPNFEPSSQTEEVQLGTWYWVYKGTDKEWFGCVTHIGSNYLKIEGQSENWEGSTNHLRVHFDKFWDWLTFCPNPEEVLKEKVQKHQNNSAAIMDEVRALTARLGLSATTARIGGPKDAPNSAGTTLAVLSGTDNLDNYKSDLVKAKEETLPELFKRLENSNRMVASWMKAEAISMQAMINPMKASLKEIDGRIFNISLYAGLTEDAHQIVEGAPAAVEAKLHVMQRRLYMDEECLLDYHAGGMEFRNISKFDEWLAKPENMLRILPFERCLVGFRVRRHEKERESQGNFMTAWINIELGKADKYTFFYIRNGDQLWRITSELEFGERIFPDQNVFDPQRPVMAHLASFNEIKTMTRDDYEARCERYEEVKILAEAWDEEHKNQDSRDRFFNRNPHRDSSYQRKLLLDGSYSSAFNPDDWSLMDQSHLYFDDYMETVKAQFDEYNRIALIIQGLFDRSMVLHPHYPVQCWDPTSFSQSISLIYDGGANLYHGEAPDFEAYWRECNAKIDSDSVLTGQHVYWMRQEAIKENARQEKVLNWNQTRPNYKLYAPYGNPGPDAVGRAASVSKKSRKATFRWMRERLKWDPYNQGDIGAVLAVPFDKLFNVSAYTPGDYKKFFLDPRTRQDYIQWAPFLLAAEDWHAGRKSPKLRDEYTRW